jgi:hypothetical protein
MTTIKATWIAVLFGFASIIACFVWSAIDFATRNANIAIDDIAGLGFVWAGMFGIPWLLISIVMLAKAYDDTKDGGRK